MDHTQDNTFKTKLYKENKSFCIDSLLSSRPSVDKKEIGRITPNRSSPPTSPSNSFPVPVTSMTPSTFPLLPPTSGFPGASHPLMTGAPHPMEALLKQELFPSQSLPLEFLARSGLFYQSYPHFAGEELLKLFRRLRTYIIIFSQDILTRYSGRPEDPERHSHRSSFLSWRSNLKKVNISPGPRDMKSQQVFVYQKLR